jgi:hypothetical protein
MPNNGIFPRAKLGIASQFYPNLSRSKIAGDFGRYPDKTLSPSGAYPSRYGLLSLRITRIFATNLRPWKMSLNIGY